MLNLIEIGRKKSDSKIMGTAILNLGVFGRVSDFWIPLNFKEKYAFNTQRPTIDEHSCKINLESDKSKVLKNRGK